MKPFDWLRLGGMIARKWPDIDFEEVEIIPTDRSDYVRVAGENIKMHATDMQLLLCVGYGPESKTLAIYHCQKPPWWDENKKALEDLKRELR